jgi:radical SAM protein with 4Fe4S-binding SPASM domain
MEDVPELLELVARLGLRRVVGGTLVRGGRAARSGLEPPAPEQYQALLSRYQTDRRFRELYERHGTLCAIEWWKARGAVRGDPCPFVEHPYVAAEGTLHPCKLFHAEAFAVAGAFDRPLRDALAEGIPRWSRLAALARQRSATLPECQPCPARLACEGGCMGRAEAASGDPGAVEDRCALRRAVHAGCPDEERGPRDCGT